MDRIQELLAKLGDCTPDEIKELGELLAAEKTAADKQENTADKADFLEALADSYDQLNAEITKRAEEQAAIDERVQAQLDRLTPKAEESGDEDDDAGDSDAGDDTDETGTGDASEVKDDAPQSVAASARVRPTLAQIAARRPKAQAPENRPKTTGGAHHTITAAKTGAQLTSRREVAAVLSRQIESQRNVRGTGEQTTAVTIATEYPADRRLSHDVSHDRNEAIIAAASAPANGGALVAAGGLCAPIPYVYDLEVVGTDARPIRDALSSFQATRGGISIRQPIRFDDLAAGVGTWTMANDAAVGVGDPSDDPVKPIVEAECPTFEDYYLQAVTARVRFSNVTARFDPEGTEANTSALGMVHSRIAEQILLNQIYAASHTATSPYAVSATRDLLAAIDHACAYYRNRHRLTPTETLWATLPVWVHNLIRTDLTRGARTAEEMNIADAAIDAFFTNRNVSVTWHLDGRSTAGTNPTVAAQQYPAFVSGSVLPGYPDQIEMSLCRPNDFLFLDGGTLDLGTVRDSALNAQNRYELFMETFEGLAFRGVESLRVVVTVKPTGLRSGFADPATMAALTD